MTKRLKISALFVLALALSGCRAAPPPTAADGKLPDKILAERIKDIQDDPTMPPDAKQRAIAVLQQQKATAPSTSP